MKCGWPPLIAGEFTYMVTPILALWDLSTLYIARITYDHPYYDPWWAFWALFGSIIPIMCNRTSSAQVRELELLNSTYNLNPKIKNLSNGKLLHLLLNGSKLYSLEINREVTKLTIKFLKSSKRFERPPPPQNLRRNHIIIFLNFNYFFLWLFLFVHHLL